jgi:hypothetical protein
MCQGKTREARAGAMPPSGPSSYYVRPIMGNTPAFNSSRSSVRNCCTPYCSTCWRVTASTPAVRDPRFWLTRDHATNNVAGSQTRFHRSQNLRLASCDPLVQLALEVKYPPLRLVEAQGRRAGVHRRPPSIRACCSFAAALPHVAGSPGLGVLRRLRHAPAATTDGAPAPTPTGRRAPPGRFPRSPTTGRQGRRPALPL